MRLLEDEKMHLWLSQLQLEYHDPWIQAPTVGANGPRAVNKGAGKASSLGVSTI